LSIIFNQKKGIMKITLPKPNLNKEVLKILNNRKTIREFSSEDLDLQTISELLWSAFGINREDKRRTAPTARNMQELELYAVTSKGIFLYSAEENSLSLIKEGDFRKDTGTQDFIGTAPVEIVITANFNKSEAPEEKKFPYAFMNSGYVSENIYFYCAAENLATVARGSVDREKLSNIMGLESYQHIILVQSVGKIG
jgi:SagB-type dehydrogenase family enzyme